MKSTASWHFNTSIENVGLHRIWNEAEDAAGGVTAVLVTMVSGRQKFYTVMCDARLARARGLGPASGYLGVDTQVTRDEDGVVCLDAALSGDIPLVCAPPGALALYLFDSHNRARALLGKALDAVGVSVEVF